MRTLLAGVLLVAAAASTQAETKILLNKSSVSSLLDVQQITVPAGERVVMSVPVLSGNVWFKNGEPILGANGRSYVIESATPADSGRYRLAYEGGETSASQELLLTVASISGANSSPRLQTFSTRGIAGAGAQSLVAGFIVSETPGQPTATKRVLIRAVGPTLEDFGVAGFLAHPQLGIYDSHGNRIQTITTDPIALAKANLSTGAFPLKPGAGDSIGLFTLSAGSYTAQVSAPQGESGLVILDVYEVPPTD